MRSLLFIPAHKISYIDNLSKNNYPDAIAIDLEDSVPTNKKKEGTLKILDFFKKKNSFKKKI